jgi:hypothetical protein
MTTIALVDTRLEKPEESIGTVVSTHDTIAAAFKGNESFQIRMREAFFLVQKPRLDSDTFTFFAHSPIAPSAMSKPNILLLG